MPGIDPEVLCHHLAIFPEAKPVSQRKRRMGRDKHKAVIKETQKLLKVSFIKQIDYATWLANVVVVKKLMENGECVLVIRI